MNKRTTQLRRLLGSPELSFIMEAHNGLSARIVEEAGFEGIWGSGLALSAQYGVRDNNEASWTQIVEMLEFMADVTTVPILLDGDTGYGNFNNMRRLVRKLEQRGVAGVCIEDKQFPKTNSFIDGERQPLAEAQEFCGKIKAGKDSQRDADFCIIARIEALIAGWPMDEALARAGAYVEAGADAVLIHSKRSKPDEILEFCRQWDGRAPVVVVPTKYYNTPTEVFRRAGVSLVIWANHLIRAAISAMQQTAATVAAEQSLVGVEDRIAPVGEVFRLQGAAELQEAEQRYVSAGRPRTRAVVLAASRGEALAELTSERPKVMLPIGGRPLLQRLRDEFRRQSVAEVTVVAGYRADAIDVAGVEVIVNEAFESAGELASLQCAAEHLAGDCVVLYGDLLFRSYVLRDLLDDEHELCVVVDSAPREGMLTGAADWAICSGPDERYSLGSNVTLQRVGNEAETARLAHGRWIGMLRARGDGCRRLGEALGRLRRRSDFHDLGITDLLNHLVESGDAVHVIYVHGHWLDINALTDLERADAFTSG